MNAYMGVIGSGGVGCVDVCFFLLFGVGTKLFWVNTYSIEIVEKAFE
jgi:hypothetical protein